MGWRADAPGIEIRRTAEKTEPPSAEQFVALDEKGPALIEHRFERGEVDVGGIRLHLAEVRIQGPIQGEVGAEAHLDVCTGPTTGLVVERIGRIDRSPQRQVAGRIRQQLETAGGADPRDAEQPTEMRRIARGGLGDQHPVVGFILVRYRALDLQPPDLLLLAGEPELGERYAHLCGPAQRVDPGPALPHRVEGQLGTVFRILAVVIVLANPSGRQRESVRGTAVQIGIERDDEDLGIAIGITAGHRAADRAGIGAIHPRADVERIAIIDQANLGSLRRWLALVRILLDEIDDGIHPGPRRIIQYPVDMRRYAGERGNPRFLLDDALDRPAPPGFYCRGRGGLRSRAARDGHSKDDGTDQRATQPHRDSGGWSSNGNWLKLRRAPFAGQIATAPGSSRNAVVQGIGAVTGPRSQSCSSEMLGIRQYLPFHPLNPSRWKDQSPLV